jgi:hypothetical protein
MDCAQNSVNCVRHHLGMKLEELVHDGQVRIERGRFLLSLVVKQSMWTFGSTMGSPLLALHNRFTLRG